VLVVDNAERLGGLAIVKAIDPQANVFVGNHPGYMDMRTGNWSDGSPEHALLALGGHELLGYYGIHLIGHHPVMMSLDKTIGVQAAIEKSLLAMLWGLMGATGICCCGSMLYAYSLAQMVIDNEMAGMVNRILEGFEINEETTAYDVIREVGVGGVYLNHPHTAKTAREAYWAPQIFDRHNLEEWRSLGEKSAIDLAREKAREILAQHHPHPLSEDTVKAMDELLLEARSELAPLSAAAGS
jgi:trimethylamine--corrinoid protein Co-methyltransferase